jgi:hypothetical protein
METHLPSKRLLIMKSHHAVNPGIELSEHTLEIKFNGIDAQSNPDIP